MWKQRYKRTFIPTQLMIVGVIAILLFHYKMPFIGLLVYWIVMELGALFGAMWTTRLVGKFERQRQRNHIDLDVL